MKKTIWIIGGIVIGLAILLFCIFNRVEQVDTNQQNVVKITEFNIIGREVLSTEAGIYIGNNIKELENDFYDIKIINTEDGVDIYLNKLWYETYDKDYIQDEYLAKICRELSSKLNISNETEQFEYLLYKYIKDNYMVARRNETIQEIKTDNLSLNMKLTEENIVKLIIRSNK